MTSECIADATGFMARRSRLIGSEENTEMTGMRTLGLAIGIAVAVRGGCERGSCPTNSTAAGGAQQLSAPAMLRGGSFTHSPNDHAVSPSVQGLGA